MGLGEDISFNIIDITNTIQYRSSDNLYLYRIYENDRLNYTLEVDLTNDQATLYYEDGNLEKLIISEHVSMEKAPDIVNRTYENDEMLANYSLSATDYIGNEPFEITSAGAQKTLGTSVYSGYEAMGSRSYVNPTESGYLQRKNSGYVTFDTYKFEISPGTKLATAAGIILAILTNAGVAIAVSIITIMLCNMLQLTSDAIIDHKVNGNFRCREYRWDYRVRRNLNTGTILLSEYRCRYWWEMYDNSGNRSLEPREGTGDGWALSNYDMIAYALGRM